MTIINKVFFKKLEEIEDDKKHWREYQCALCDYKSSYKKEALSHMSVKHTEVNKKYFDESGDLDVEYCGICKKIFYSEEELKKHEDERTRLCGICDLCLTPDSDEFKYCVAMEH